MKKLFIIAIILFLLPACKDSGLKLHYDAFVADTHNDVLLRVMRGDDITGRSNRGHTDIPRLKEGGIDLEVFVIWVDPYKYLPDSSYIRANAMIDALEDIQEKTSDHLGIVRNFADLEINEKQGKISAFIGVEGGHPIENDLDKLKALHSRGMRYLGITWNNSTDWATSAKDETLNDSLVFKGLTPFGREVIRTCNELGVLVDVSHCGEETFWDIMETTKDPIIASHSCVYNLCPHFRNLKDNQLDAIRENGGVVFVNYYSGYIDSTYQERQDVIRERHQDSLDSLAAIYTKESEDYWYKSQELMRSDLAAISPPLDMLIDHIDYIAKRIGPDHVGLGSDFDGVSSLPKGMEDCSKVPAITKKLLERGYSENDIRKILGKNFQRVFKAVVG